MGFIAFIFCIVIFAVFNKEIKLLKRDVERLKSGKLLSETTPTDAPVHTSVKQPPQASAVFDSSPDRISSFFSWYSTDWPLKTGGLFIILGFVWLVSYAFLNNWIGEQGRIMLGLVCGAITIAFGDRWIIRSRAQGTVLVGIGASIMMVTIWAAQSLYDMFPPIVALGLGALVMIMSAISSLRHNDRSLIAIALVIGSIAPLLTGSTDTNILALYSYLLIVVCSSLWIVYFKQWRFLTTLALMIVTMYSIQFFTGSSYTYESLLPSEQLTLHFFAVTFSSLFYFASVIGVYRKQGVEKPEVITAVLGSLYVLGWIHGITPNYLQSLIAAGVSIAFMVAAYVAVRATDQKAAVYMYIVPSVILLIAATAYAFEGPVLIMALSVQAALLPIVLSRLLDKKIGKGMLLSFFLPIVLSVESFYAPSWSTGILHNDFVALASVTMALFVAGLYFYYQDKRDTDIRSLATVIIVFASVYGLLVLWVVNHALFEVEGVARTITLTGYIIIGLITHLKGQSEKRLVLDRFGFILILLVIVRLLFVEVWTMILAWRIVTFFAIGLLLMGSVLLRKAR